jgi:tRNA(Ile)-lysidine synthase
VEEKGQSLTLPERLVAAWPAHQWRDVHVMAAISGGADSVALLRALLEAKRATGGAGRVLAAHVNHQLRVDSNDDEAWVRQQCLQWDVPVVVRRVDVASLAAQRGDGVEAAAREARYRVLVEMAEETGTRFVVTAHTREDQVETVLFRLVRGTGLRGLAGMQRARALSPCVTLVRPLLDCTRAELRAYLEGHSQTWREDPMNRDSRFARNRLRETVLPLLREHFNPEADKAVARAAELVAEAQDVIDSLATTLAETCGMSADAGGVTLHTAPLAGQPTLLVVETLRQGWRAAGWPEQAMSRAWWSELASLAHAEKDDRVLNLPGDVLARREGDLLSLARRAGLP